MRRVRDDPDDLYVLAVDLGTGGPKVGLVSLTGRLAWHDHQRVETTWLAGGGAVQDAVLWWDLVRRASRLGIASGAVDPGRIVAVGVTGLWASTVPVDASGTPVGDCILWMDSRGAPYSDQVIGGPVAGYAPAAALSFIRRSGGAPSTHGADPVGHMLYLMAEEPEVVARSRWLLEPVDYLTMCFTGRPAASHASMTAAWLTDNRRLDRLVYDKVLVRRAGVDPSRLPPLVPTGSVVGTVTDAVASELGLPPAVAVVTGIPDLHSGACGAGAVRDFETHMAVSTSSWIGAPVPFKKTDPIRQIASVPGLGAGFSDPASAASASASTDPAHPAASSASPSPGPGGYLIANNHETAGVCLDWLRDSLLLPLEAGKAMAGYGELTEMAAQSRPGSGAVMFTPWLNGERSPVDDRRARGGFLNLSISTTRADLVRSVLEGVAYNDRWLHTAVERFAGRRLEPIRMIGGGASSELWCQIHADVMDRVIERVAEPIHANLRGVAIFAALSLGAIRVDDMRDLVEVDGVFRPQATNRAIYDRIFREFPRLYKVQRPMFARLNDPT